MAVNIELETILLVDDCTDDVFFFERSLRRAGLDNPLVVVPNGREAMAYLRGENEPEFPSLCAVVMELFLPCETGFELLKWIRTQPHLEGLPIIVVTSSIRKKDFELACELGANKVFPKTCNPDDLREVAAYLKDLSCHHCHFFESDAKHAGLSSAERDASELLGTLSARLKD